MELIEILGGFLALLFGWGGIFICCVVANKYLTDQQSGGAPRETVETSKNGADSQVSCDDRSVGEP